jgi:hypothetical protein
MNEKHKLERRAFNEALRARLKLVAAERNVPDDQMKWLGRLRHDDLGLGVLRRSERSAAHGQAAPPATCNPRRAAMKRRRQSRRKRNRQLPASHARRLKR